MGSIIEIINIGSFKMNIGLGSIRPSFILTKLKYCNINNTYSSLIISSNDSELKLFLQ